MELRTVKEIAEWIVEISTPFYSKDFLRLIPEELLNKKLTDENLFKTMEQVDVVRFEKEKELKSKIETERTIEMSLYDVINYPDALPKELEKKRREIKFLFNVAALIVHQLRCTPCQDNNIC